MHYRIQHTTRFDYSQPIHESVMELRMHPRTEATQRCLEFEIELTPAARMHRYTDFLGNIVQHFDIPSAHEHLEIVAAALVEVSNFAELPRALAPDAWRDLDRTRDLAEHQDWLYPTELTQPSDRLAGLLETLGIRRRDDPLTVLRELNTGLHRALRYERGSTRADSPIDECLTSGKGVCQDFAHVFIAAARGLGVPARYVSGYLFRSRGTTEGPAGDATHAWTEAFLPEVGWMGFDPSNNVTAGPAHVRVAVGRDYRDVPPTRGVFKGIAETKLTVHVDVTEGDADLRIGGGRDVRT